MKGGIKRKLRLSGCLPVYPWSPSMRCTGYDSSDLNSENLFQQQPVFISSLRVFFLLCSMYCTLSFANRASTSVVTDFFSRGHDPFAHACNARPLTIVGWTSVSVSCHVMSCHVGSACRVGATVLTDVESDELEIARGTMQGDPLSSLFFNSVPQSAMDRTL